MYQGYVSLIKWVMECSDFFYSLGDVCSLVEFINFNICWRHIGVEVYLWKDFKIADSNSKIDA